MSDKEYPFGKHSPLYTDSVEHGLRPTRQRTHCMRILKLRPGPKTAPLESNLFVRDLRPSDGDIQEPYDALSYNWGPAGGNFFVRIFEGGEVYRISIRRNLDAALRQLRRTDAPILLWVDTLCIDQKNKQEKSLQIPLMNEIYKHAECVRVWLGEEADNSSEAMDFVLECVDLDNFDLLVRDATASKRWAALSALMRRPWFNRRWIIQEIALARKAEVHCGSKSISWEEFAFVVSMVAKKQSELRQLFRESTAHHNHPDYLGDMSELGAIRLADLSDNLFRKADDGVIKLFSLEALMASLTAFEASDPHDILYAVLWLAYDAVPVNKNAVTNIVSWSSLFSGLNSPTDFAMSPQVYAKDTPSAASAGSDGYAEEKPRPPLPRQYSQGDFNRTASSVPTLALNGANQRSQVPNGLGPTSERPEDSNAGQPSSAPVSENLADTTDSGGPFFPLTNRPRSRQNTTSSLTPQQFDNRHLRPRVTSISTASANSADFSSLTDEQKAAIGFLDALKHRQIIVDYDKSVLEVCKDLLEFTMKRSKSLDILCVPWAPNDETLPTWIPQRRGSAFSPNLKGVYRRKNADPLVGRLGHASGGPKQYRASKEIVADWKLGGDDGRTLTVAGFVLDEVREKTAPAAGGVIPVEWLRVGGWENPDKLPRDVFWRTVVGNRDLHGNPPSPYWAKACQNAFNRRVQDGDIDTNDIRHDCPSFVEEFVQRAQQMVWGRRLITLTRQTPDKCLGLAPEKTRKGDLICILYGCTVPVVLREMAGGERAAKRRKCRHSACPSHKVDIQNASSNHFHFIGECYVHGMMSGEAFGVKKQYDVQNQNFNLC